MHDSLTPATATIDAGRLLTLERRERFSGLSLQLIDNASGEDRIIDCITRPESAGVLSERHIYRALTSLPELSPMDEADARYLGSHAGFIAAWVHTAMRDWANSGFYQSRDGLVDLITINVDGVNVGIRLYHSL
jgi:hypothetical protein